MNLRNHIKKILNEETKLGFDEEFENNKEVIQDLVKDYGLDIAVKYVGSLDDIIKFGYDNNIEEFSKETNFKLVRISEDGMNMYINDLVIQTLNLEKITRWSSNEIILGDFVWKSGGFNYKFTAYGRSFISQVNDQKLWRVVGTCGDHGFGYSFINRKNTIGKRGRAQIFKQIIKKFDLEKYL